MGELARAFNRMAEDLATVDRQRRELVANVSHELRTPLNMIIGFADLSEMVASLKSPRKVMLMVEAGRPVDAVGEGAARQVVGVPDGFPRGQEGAAFGPQAGPGGEIAMRRQALVASDGRLHTSA